MSEVWALIDVNNFFVSCERVFRPDLATQPVLVLSNNDGCVVSRSSEVKRLGIPMGAPRFQIEDKIKQYGVRCFSSNFRLYGDMSSRVMRTIREEVGGENQEIYSIDECFVRLTHLPITDFAAWGRRVRSRLWRELGIPVTVGVAPTKTLAKLAVEIAKKDVLGDGVMWWPAAETTWREQYLRLAPITNVWGIGRASARQLLGRRVDTVGKFMDLEGIFVRRLLGLAGERTWQELHGVSCIELTQAPAAHRQILRSRSFGEPVYRRDELEHALAAYLSIASENLRRHGWRASLVTVSIRTSRFAEAPRRYANAQTVGLEQSSSYLPDLMAALRRGLRAIYRPHFAYKKAGVILSGLEEENAWQPRLLSQASTLEPSEDKKQAVMRAVEQLNHGYGSRQVGLGLTLGGAHAPGQQVQEKWRSRATARSPEYSTSWADLRVVR